MKPNGTDFFNELTKNLQQWEKTASSPEVSLNNATETQTAQKASQTTKMAEVLGELVKIAEELDNNGSTKAADLVDTAIKSIAHGFDTTELAEEEFAPSIDPDEEGMGTRGEPNRDEIEGAPEGLESESAGELGQPFNADKIDQLLADPTTRDYLKRKLQGI